ncbi:papain family cysteine protease, partial [Cooperia oncophora]
ECLRIIFLVERQVLQLLSVFFRHNHGLRARKEKTLRQKIDEAFDKWDDYKEAFGKSYDPEEENDFMEAFVKNMIHIEEHNKEHRLGRKTFEMGVNEIADLPFSQYRKLNGYRHRRQYGDSMPSNGTKFLAPFNVEIPNEVDWREKGLVTPVKNQGMCGSCWAFSTTGALEGQHARATGKMVSLSEQNLVDCSTKYGNHGCNGGLMDLAFEYIKENHGVDTEESYPYVGRDMKCHFKKSDVGADDKGFVDLPEGDEEALKVAVATQGPISIAIDAGHRTFQLYKKGVYYDEECSSEELDHGVLLVGYGTDPEAVGQKTLGSTKGYIRICFATRNQSFCACKPSSPQSWS